MHTVVSTRQPKGKGCRAGHGSMLQGGSAVNVVCRSWPTHSLRTRCLARASRVRPQGQAPGPARLRRVIIAVVYNPGAHPEAPKFVLQM